MLLKIILKENVEDCKDTYRINFEDLLPLLEQGLKNFLREKFSENLVISKESDEEIINLLRGFIDIEDEKGKEQKSTSNKPRKQDEKVVLNIYLLNRQKNFQEINVSFFSLIDLFPEVGKEEKSKPLFFKNTKNKILVWQVCIKKEESKDNNKNETIKIYRKSGFIDGKINESSKEVLLNESGRDIYEQSIIIFKSEINKKKLKGYLEDLNNPVDNVSPMLANLYDPQKIKKWPVLLQLKLDGIRCFSTVDSQGNVILKTRENKEILQEFKDIREQIKLLFQYLENVKYLDGELFCEEDFSTLSSIVKTVERHEKENIVKYFVFDFIEKPKVKNSNQNTKKEDTLLQNKKGLTYQERYEILYKVFAKFCYEHFNEQKPKQKINTERKVRLLHCYTCNNDEEVQKYFNEFVKKGHEGVIIRNPESLYRFTRCDDLLKLKKFYDKEFEIVDVESGNGKDKDLAILVVRDEDGTIIKVRPKADNETRKKWLLNKQTVLNKNCTVRYYKKSEGGSYIMPVAIAIRDYE